MKDKIFNDESAKYYFDLSARSYHESKYKEATEYIDAAINIDPFNIIFLYHKVCILSIVGKKDEAKVCFESTANLFGDLTSADLLYKGNALSALGNYKYAIKAYKKVIELDNTNATAWINLASVYFYEKEYQKSIECCDGAILINPNNAKFYLTKGVNLFNIDDIDSAIQFYDMAINIDPNLVKAYLNKAHALVALKNTHDAEQCYDKAIELAPNNPLCYYGKAKFLADTLNRKEDALVCYNQARDISNNIGQFISESLSFRKIQLINQTAGAHKEKISKEINELHKATLNATRAILSLEDQSNPLVRNAVEKFKTLEKAKKLITKAAFTQINKCINPISLEEQIEKDNILGMLKKDPTKLPEILEKYPKACNYAEIIPFLMKSMIRLEQEIGSNLGEIKGDMIEIKYTIQDFSNEIKNMKHAMEASGVYDKAKIRQGFATLCEESPILYEYAKAFYWTLLNYFAAYRSIGTNLVSGNTDAVGLQGEDLMVAGLEVASSYVVDMAVNAVEEIPIVGNIIGLLDNVVSGIYNAVQNKRLEDKADAINSIIMHNRDPKALIEEDFSILIALTSLDVALAKQKEIIYPNFEHQSSSLQQAIDWFDEKVNKIKEFALGKGIDIYDNPAAQLALKDVALLLAYLYKNYEIVINKNESLCHQFSKIIICNKAEDMLNQYTVLSDLAEMNSSVASIENQCADIDGIKKDHNEKHHNQENYHKHVVSFNETTTNIHKNSEINHQENNRSSDCCNLIQNKCTIFAVPAVRYDNPFLNNPKLLTLVMQTVSFDQLMKAQEYLTQGGLADFLTNLIKKNDANEISELIGDVLNNPVVE